CPVLFEASTGRLGEELDAVREVGGELAQRVPLRARSHNAKPDAGNACCGPNRGLESLRPSNRPHVEDMQVCPRMMPVVGGGPCRHDLARVPDRDDGVDTAGAQSAAET